MTKQKNESVATYEPRSEGSKRFVHKHFGPDNKPVMAPGFQGKDRAGNGDDIYNGSVKPFVRSDHRMGYNAAPSDQDEKVYEGKTWRRGDGERHQARAWVKKVMRKKMDKDARRDARMSEEAVNEGTYAEGENRVKVYKDTHKQCCDLVDEIKDGLSKHKETAMKTEEGYMGKDSKGNIVSKRLPAVHWGHIGDLRAHRATLEQIRDALHGRGEYASAPVAIRREEAGLVEWDDSGDSIHDVRRKMMAANKVHALGVKHGDKSMQDAAKKRLSQLAKLHSQLTQNAQEQVSPEFKKVLDEINQIIAEDPLAKAARFIEAVGDEKAEEILGVIEHLDDEAKGIVKQLFNDEQWDELIELFSEEE